VIALLKSSEHGKGSGVGLEVAHLMGKEKPGRSWGCSRFMFWSPAGGDVLFHILGGGGERAEEGEAEEPTEI